MMMQHAEAHLAPMGDHGSPSGAGKIRGYPKHRAAHAAAAAPYRTRESHQGGTGRRVYVGNLAWDVKTEILKNHMRISGDVEECEVKQELNGRSKGCGIVTFATHAMAMDAISRLSDTELLGRKIFVREDREEAKAQLAAQSAYTPAPVTSYDVPPTSYTAAPVTSYDIPQTSYSHTPAPYAPPTSFAPPPQHGFAPNNPFAPTSGGGTRVYVGNLSWSVKWQDLKDHMKQAGNVLHADVMLEPTGRSKGCGIVEYDTPEAAQRAIQMLTDTKLDNRPIFVREDREPRPGHRGPPMARGGPPPFGARPGAGHHSHPPMCTVYIGNLPFDAMWQDVKDVARSAATVDHVEVIQGPDGRSKGYALVRTPTPEDAQIIIGKLHDTEFRGRFLEVRLERVR
ncbi:hypothetical protein SDRG_00824 [Saprolegnia diclina VS20]|uniref:RRM domain-containing protein n=1 Tax=Saprolegnia diclina (strain VS20) TaxID=1156394 RepID=T0R6B3_SAPDV|nr:hypothetical protein SDRG_00824 [Saprolegnia diclina VS20]EQC41975.1 hypothetical protein SDRG_00824 [Saprolegnia diclina VS20]|eukprot:XP_008604544.1 hypothetical protein SDRG_00824 [Saprolegnia diclina VS20]